MPAPYRGGEYAGAMDDPPGLRRAVVLRTLFETVAAQLVARASNGSGFGGPGLVYRPNNTSHSTLKEQLPPYFL